MADNTGKVKLRRATTAHWAPATVPAIDTALFTGQLGIEYRPDATTPSIYTTRSPRLKVGNAGIDGADLATPNVISDSQFQTDCKYIAPDPDIYTDTAVFNDGSDRLVATNTPIGATVGGSAIADGGAGLGAMMRNVVITNSSTTLTASNYQEGTVWLIYN